MQLNYLKDEFYNYIQQNEILFDKLLNSNTHYFFIWDFENQNNLFISDEILLKLGYLEISKKNEYNNWQNKLQFLNSEKFNDDLQNIEIQLISNENELYNVQSQIYYIKTDEKINKVIGILDTNWINCSINFEQIQYEIIFNLYKNSVSIFNNIVELEKQILRHIAKGLQVSQVSFWTFNNSNLVCENLYNLNQNKFILNNFIKENTFHDYFLKLQIENVLNISEIEKNSFSKELYENYFLKNKIISLLEIPILQNGKIEKIVSLENVEFKKIWQKKDINFVNTILDIYANFKEKILSRARKNELELNNNRFEFISNNIVEGIYIIENEELVFTSNKYLELIGLTYEEKLQSFTNDRFGLVHPEDVERLKTHYFKILNQKLKNTTVLFRCKHKSGKYFWRQDSLNIQYNKIGTVIRVVVIARDISEIKNFEMEQTTKNFEIIEQNNLLIKLFKENKTNTFNQKVTNVLKIASKGLHVNRISFWLLKNKDLFCYSLFDSNTNSYTKGNKIPKNKIPIYLQAIKNNTELIVENTFDNPYTTELIEGYFDQLGIKKMLDLPIRENGVTVGVLCCEDIDNKEKWTEYDVTFTRSLADFISISIEEENRKKAEKALLINQEKFKFVSENTSDGILVFNKNKLTFASSAYIKNNNYTNTDIYKLKLIDFFEKIHPNDKNRIKNIVLESIKNKAKKLSYEYQLLLQNGEYAWREDSADIIYDVKGNFQKYILISRDIHQRKLAENREHESEIMLKQISENTSDGVAVIEKGILTYLSPSFAKNLKIDSIVNKAITYTEIFSRFHPDDLEKTKKLITTNLKNKVKQFSYEIRFLNNEGNYNWQEDSANVIYDTNGNYEKYIVVTRDINERKKSEQENKRLYEITEKQNERLTNFTHIVSHDIRSHTSNLSMILELFEESKNKTEQKEYFEMLKESTQKLSETIFYLNESVAIQNGIKIEKKLLNLNQIIKSTITSIKAIVQSNNAKINIQIENDIYILATKAYLESIFLNLITNAIKYKKQNIDPIIEIIAQKNNSEILFTISDNGLGIDLEKHGNKIFGMYKTFHQNSDSVGLGLFMVKTQIEALGGSIEIESQVNVGTKFKLFFNNNK